MGLSCSISLIRIDNFSSRRCHIRLSRDTVQRLNLGIKSVTGGLTRRGMGLPDKGVRAPRGGFLVHFSRQGAAPRRLTGAIVKTSSGKTIVHLNSVTAVASHFRLSRRGVIFSNGSSTLLGVHGGGTSSTLEVGSQIARFIGCRRSITPSNIALRVAGSLSSLL